MRHPTLSVAAFALLLNGCAGAIVEPGHRGLLFNPSDGGLKHEVLTPGYYSLEGCTFKKTCSRIDDFDISYSTRKEEITTTSAEGLALTIKIAVIYRPIVSELYELDTEIGPNYYEEVIGPEFRSAARGVFSRHPYQDLQKQNEKIEDEVEQEVRRRTAGKHVDIASITMESVFYAPEIAHAVQAKLVGEQEAIRQKAAIEAESLKRKLEIENSAEQRRLQAAAELQDKKNERAMEEQQAAIDKAKAEADAATRIISAKAQAEETTILAKAERERHKSEQLGISPLTVMMHAYDALGKMGGTGTTIMLGDWSRTPQVLFPSVPGFQSMFGAGAARASSRADFVPFDAAPAPNVPAGAAPPAATTPASPAAPAARPPSAPAQRPRSAARPPRTAPPTGG
jgi:regulator of protease activity HflC (stomatin/prohibitin superfamily)